MLPLQVLELKLVIGNLLVSLIEENSPDSLIVAMVNLVKLFIRILVYIDYH